MADTTADAPANDYDPTERCRACGSDEFAGGLVRGLCPACNHDADGTRRPARTLQETR